MTPSPSTAYRRATAITEREYPRTEDERADAALRACLPAHLARYAAYGNAAVAVGAADYFVNLRQEEPDEARRTNAADTIANILHAAACDTADAAGIVARALDNYEAEVAS